MTAAEKHAAGYEATVAALARRAGRARPNDYGGHDWALGTGQVIRTALDGTRLDIYSFASLGPATGVRGAGASYQVAGISTAKTPTRVCAGILQAIIDGELETSIAAGQAAARKIGLT